MTGQPGLPLAFEGLVDTYAAHRPDYPEALFAELGPLAGSVVLELGAGTGLATRSLLARGARVVTTDLGPKMLRANPNRASAVARAECLPVRSGCVDLVCAAHMWHWVDRDRGVPEVARVLVDGGSFACWWNVEVGDGRAWFDEQQQELERLVPGYSRGAGRFRVEPTHEFRWRRDLTVADYLDLHRSRSYVDVMAPDVRREFLEHDRARLAQAFPDGLVAQHYRTVLSLQRKENL